MMQFDRITLGRQAKELGFVRDTFEKVCRLADVLAFMESRIQKRHMARPTSKSGPTAPATSWKK